MKRTSERTDVRFLLRLRRAFCHAIMLAENDREGLAMKLAEALQERADAKRLIARLNTRLAANAVAQEGEAPAEDPSELLKALDGCLARMETLMAKINLVNSATVVGGRTLTEMIARRDCLRERISAYQKLIDAASQSVQRMGRAEIRIVRTVDVRALQKQVDALCAEQRRLDNEIQHANWMTEIDL